MTAQIIQLNGGSEGAAVLRKLADKLEESRIDSLVVMAYEPYTKEELSAKGKDPQFQAGIIHRYWFCQGQLASLNLLGLIDYAKCLVRKYLIDDIDLVRGD